MICFTDAPTAPTDTDVPTSSHPDTEALGDEIAELAAHIHAATYRMLALLAEFDRREGWGGGGFRSCAHWLSWRTGIALGAAREKVRVAWALRELPTISASMRGGTLSFSKARTPTRVATPENEEELLELADHGTTAHVERLVRAWRQVDRNQAAELDRARHESRSLSLYQDEDGSWVLRGRLDPEVGAVLRKALDAAAEELRASVTSAAPAAPGSAAPATPCPRTWLAAPTRPTMPSARPTRSGSWPSVRSPPRKSCVGRSATRSWCTSARGAGSGARSGVRPTIYTFQLKRRGGCRATRPRCAWIMTS